MIRQIFKMRTFLACVLAAVTGMVLCFCYPFPDENFFLELIFLWARPEVCSPATTKRRLAASMLLPLARSLI